jgi:hypothetical protein
MPSVRRRQLAVWLLSFPLMVVGSQVAHAVAYSLVYPDAHLRLNELLSTGHGYMHYPAYLPLLMGLVGAAELVGMAWVLAGSVRRSLRRPVPPWAFALLPMIGFALQEFFERWLSGSPFPWSMVLQPTFRVGLLLQLPFALAAYLIAKLLLRAADRVGRVLRGAVARARVSGVSVCWVVLEVRSPRRGAPASGHSGRGPPRMVVADTAPAR